MNKQDAADFLTAKVECMEKYTSGIYEDCNSDCDNCKLSYLQGTIGEQMEALRMAIDALRS